MAFYIVKRIEGPKDPAVVTNVARTYIVEDTDTNVVTPYHIEVRAEDALDAAVWLQVLQDVKGCTPNDFGLT